MRPVKIAPGRIVVELSMHDAICLTSALGWYSNGMDNVDAPLCDALAAAIFGYALLAEGKENYQEEDGTARHFYEKWATYDTYHRPIKQVDPPPWIDDVTVTWDSDSLGVG